MDLDSLLRGQEMEPRDVIAAGTAQRVAHPLGGVGTEVISEGTLVFGQSYLVYLSDSEQVTVPYTDIKWYADNGRAIGSILVLRRQDDWMAFRLERDHARNAEKILSVEKGVSGIRTSGTAPGAMWNPPDGD